MWRIYVEWSDCNSMTLFRREWTEVLRELSKPEVYAEAGKVYVTRVEDKDGE